MRSTFNVHVIIHISMPRGSHSLSKNSCSSWASHGKGVIAPTLQPRIESHQRRVGRRGGVFAGYLHYPQSPYIHIILVVNHISQYRGDSRSWSCLNTVTSLKIIAR
jgi:hypothetical protein